MHATAATLTNKLHVYPWRHSK